MSELRPLMPRATVPRKRHPLSPEKPVVASKKDKSLSGTLAFSGVAIFVIMFSMGLIPQADALISNANDSLHTYNDQIVNAILFNLPAALVTVGVVGLSLMLFGAFRRRGAAKT